MQKLEPTKTLTIYTENKPAVIARIANLLRKRNISIEAIRADTKKMVANVNGVKASVIEIVAEFKDEHQCENVARQIERLINVLKVNSKIKF